MKKINSKLIISLSLGAMIMSGCVAKEPHTPRAFKTIKYKKSKNKMIKKQVACKTKGQKPSKEECPECYASILKPKSENKAIFSYDYVNTRKNSTFNRDLEKIIVSRSIESENGYNYVSTSADTYGEADDFSNENKAVEMAHYQPVLNENSGKKSIQVGAFRRHVGAETYANKYRMLSHQYNVAIKKNIEQNRPMYRVQIEGFSSEYEARKFIARNSITGAFLVRK